MKTVKCPVREIASVLRGCRDYARTLSPHKRGGKVMPCTCHDSEHEYADVRLQVHADGRFSVHTGSSDYDQDHRGAWGSGSIPLTADFDSMALAKKLWNEAADMAVDMGDDMPILMYAGRAGSNALAPKA